MKFLTISPSVAADSRQTLKVAAPLIGTRILRTFSGFICMVMIAQLGQSAVAGGALIVGTANTLMLIFGSLFYSIAVIIGRIVGEGEKKAVGEILQSSFLLSTVIGLLLSIIIWNAKYILLFFHQQPYLISLTQNYFHALTWGVLPSLWIVCLDEFFIGILQSKMVIYWTAISSVLNMLLAYLLLFGKFGFPNLGIAGVGYAAAIVYWLMFFIVIIYLYMNHKYRVYELFKLCSLHYIRKIFRIGWPISLQLGSISASYSVLTYMIGWSGESSLAAHQIANQFDNLVIMLPYGMAQATGVLVSQAVGSQKKTIEQLWKIGTYMVGTIVLFFSLLYWLMPKLLISIYLNLHDFNNQNSIHLAVILLSIVSVTQFVDSIGITVSGALRGLHDTKIPMHINILISWLVNIPLGYILAFVFNFGAPGLYFSFCLGAILSSFFLFKRLHSFEKIVYN